MAIYKILEEIMQEKDVSIADIARLCNLSDSTVRGIIKRKQDTIALEVAFKLSKGLGVSLEKLNGMPEDSISNANSEPTQKIQIYSSNAMQLAQDYDTKLDNWGKHQVRSVADNEIARYAAECAKNTETVKTERKRVQSDTVEEIESEFSKIINLRFSELKASAGTGYQLDDDQTTTWKVLYNEYTRMADFCLEVDGQSMEPKIFDGDIILIRQQPAVDVGEIGLFTVDDAGYVKKQGEDRLISINPNYDDIFPNEYANVICRGKVIGVLDPAWIVEQ